MKKKDFTRRRFIATVSAGSIAAVASGAVPAFGNLTGMTQKAGKLAILGGNPVRKNKNWPAWPYVDEKMVD